MTQGEAVFQAVSQVFDVSEVVPPTTSWSDSQKEQVHGLVLNSFKSGATTHNGSPTEAQLIKYIPGLVNNWVRKDKRMNGGNTYTAKRPGSRTGSGDESIKAMRMLLAATQDPNAKREIQSAIDARVAELKPKAVINVAAIPESLRHLVK